MQCPASKQVPTLSVQCETCDSVLSSLTLQCNTHNRLQIQAFKSRSNMGNHQQVHDTKIKTRTKILALDLMGRITQGHHLITDHLFSNY